jgi:hypothetical protein
MFNMTQEARYNLNIFLDKKFVHLIPINMGLLPNK